VSVGEVGVELQCPVRRRDRPVAHFCRGNEPESCAGLAPKGFA
jgi:hypothetical protein